VGGVRALADTKRRHPLDALGRARRLGERRASVSTCATTNRRGGPCRGRARERGRDGRFRTAAVVSPARSSNEGTTWPAEDWSHTDPAVARPGDGRVSPGLPATCSRGRRLGDGEQDGQQTARQRAGPSRTSRRQLLPRRASQPTARGPPAREVSQPVLLRPRIAAGGRRPVGRPRCSEQGSVRMLAGS